jgi:hypothetical protein
MLERNWTAPSVAATSSKAVTIVAGLGRLNSSDCAASGVRSVGSGATPEISMCSVTSGAMPDINR